MLAAFGQALGFLLCLAFPVGVVLLAVFARRWHDKRLAEHWRKLQARRALAGDGAAVAIVNRVYQRARRGTKAVIRWSETGQRQDTWFEGRRPAQGSVLLLRGSTGWGPHNRNPNTYYVYPGELLYSAPRGTIAAARRQRRRDAKK